MNFQPIIFDKSKSLFVKTLKKRVDNYFKDNKIDYNKMPGCLLPNHGVYVWGTTKQQALENAIVIEEIAKLAFLKHFQTLI